MGNEISSHDKRLKTRSCGPGGGDIVVYNSLHASFQRALEAAREAREEVVQLRILLRQKKQQLHKEQYSHAETRGELEELRARLRELERRLARYEEKSDSSEEHRTQVFNFSESANAHLQELSEALKDKSSNVQELSGALQEKSIELENALTALRELKDKQAEAEREFLAREEANRRDEERMRLEAQAALEELRRANARELEHLRSEHGEREKELSSLLEVEREKADARKSENLGAGVRLRTKIVEFWHLGVELRAGLDLRLPDDVGPNAQVYCVMSTDLADEKLSQTQSAPALSAKWDEGMRDFLFDDAAVGLPYQPISQKFADQLMDDKKKRGHLAAELSISEARHNNNSNDDDDDDEEKKAGGGGSGNKEDEEERKTPPPPPAGQYDDGDDEDDFSDDADAPADVEAGATHPNWLFINVFLFDPDKKSHQDVLLGEASLDLRPLFGVGAGGKFDGVLELVRTDEEDGMESRAGLLETKVHCTRVPEVRTLWLSGYDPLRIGQLLEVTQVAAGVTSLNSDGTTDADGDGDGAEGEDDEAARAAKAARARKASLAHDAARQGSPDMLLTALAAGANIEGLNKAGRTPLMVAAARGHWRVVRALIEHRANPEATDDNGDTALAHAAKNGYARIVQALLVYLANTGLKKTALNLFDTLGRTAVAHAASNGHSRCVRRLVQAGADASISARGGLTPLHLAAHMGEEEVVSELVSMSKEFDIDANAQDSLGRTYRDLQLEAVKMTPEERRLAVDAHLRQVR